ncbi:MAG: hypothetical protein ACI9BD_000037 [Candidatus Marinamargulisbacteria bacterium]|jgi:hypothetical protein
MAAGMVSSYNPVTAIQGPREIRVGTGVAPNYVPVDKSNVDATPTNFDKAHTLLARATNTPAIRAHWAANGLGGFIPVAAG